MPTSARPPAPSVSSADEIAKLAQLKDQGVLTDAEFERAEGQAARRLI